MVAPANFRGARITARDRGTTTWGKLPSRKWPVFEPILLSNSPGVYPVGQPRYNARGDALDLNDNLSSRARSDQRAQARLNLQNPPLEQEGKSHTVLELT